MAGAYQALSTAPCMSTRWLPGARADAAAAAGWLPGARAQAAVIEGEGPDTPNRDECRQVEADSLQEAHPQSKGGLKIPSVTGTCDSGFLAAREGRVESALADEIRAPAAHQDRRIRDAVPSSVLLGLGLLAGVYGCMDLGVWA